MNSLSETRILFLEDDTNRSEVFFSEAQKQGVKNLVVCSNTNQALQMLRYGAFDLFITDLKYNLGNNFHEINTAEIVKISNPDIRVILLNDYFGVHQGVISDFKSRGIDIYDKNNFIRKFSSILTEEMELDKSSKIFNYQNKLISNLASGFNENVIDPPQILTDIRTINKSYVDLIKKNPKLMYDLTPRQFEEFTGEYGRLDHQVPYFGDQLFRNNLTVLNYWI